METYHRQKYKQPSGACKVSCAIVNANLLLLSQKMVHDAHLIPICHFLNCPMCTINNELNVK